jgi:hypothetical protein
LGTTIFVSDTGVNSMSEAPSPSPSPLRLFELPLLLFDNVPLEREAFTAGITYLGELSS